MARLSNDSATLVSRTSFDGPELRFDFPGLEIGVAEYDEGPTGCTVFSFPSGPVPCSVDVRGGSPAVSGAGIDFVDAICLAGGALYGPEAAGGGPRRGACGPEIPHPRAPHPPCGGRGRSRHG